MKIDYLSDIHIDFYIPKECNKEEFMKRFFNIQSIIFPVRFDTGKVLCITGDVSHFVHQIVWVLEFYSEMYDYVLYVHGNHEMYCLEGEASFRDKLNLLKEEISKLDKVHYLNGDTIEIDGILFGGTSMWYDFSYGIKNFNLDENIMYQNWKTYLKDAQKIKDGDTIDYIVFKDIGIVGISFDTKKYFEEQYENLLKLKECDVIISHVMPFIPNDYPKKLKIASTGYFCFDGEEFISQSKVKIWIAGHTHTKVEAKKFGVNLLTNPYGYPNENWDKRMRQIEI